MVVTKYLFISQIQFGQPVYTSFGVEGLYSFFVLGGVAAAAPSYLHVIEEKNILNDVEKALNIKSELLPRFLLNFMKKRMTNFAESVISKPCKACGSSGAVTCFMGAGVVITLYDTYNSMTAFVRKWKRSGHQMSIINAAIQDSTSMYYFFNRSLDILRVIWYLKSEMNNAFGSRIVSESATALARFEFFVNRFHSAKVMVAFYTNTIISSSRISQISI